VGINANPITFVSTIFSKFPVFNFIIQGNIGMKKRNVKNIVNATECMKFFNTKLIMKIIASSVIINFFIVFLRLCMLPHYILFRNYVVELKNFLFVDSYLQCLDLDVLSICN